MTFVVGGIVGPLLLAAAVWGLFGQTPGLMVGGLALLSGLIQVMFARGDSESWLSHMSQSRTGSELQ